MRIVFVRHGHPDYKLDCLTELGHRQAEAAAQRLQDEGITEIYSSPKGRAVETAQYTADLLALPVQILPFMQEISFRPIEDGDSLPHNGNPWQNADDMVKEGKSLHSPAWQTEYPCCRSRVVASVNTIVPQFDEWLSGFGYSREADYYRVTKDTDKTIALFSHAGASMAAISRMFNLPFLFACNALSPDLTGVTVVSLSGREGELVAPHFEIHNDARHIRGMEEKNIPSE